MGLRSTFPTTGGRFAKISAVLHASTSVKKKKVFWTEKHDAAFLELKEKLTTPYVPAYPRLDAPFFIQTDASSTAVGAVLVQKQQKGKINHV